MEGLTDAQVTARVRRLWRRYYRLAPLCRHVGWDYNHVYSILRRSGALSEFGLGRANRLRGTKRAATTSSVPQRGGAGGSGL